MKHDRRFKLLLAFNLILVLGIVWLGQPLRSQAQEPALTGVSGGTAFTYQGRLTDSGSPANGVYDLRFILYDAEMGGAQVGSVVSLEDVTASDGFFTVQLDFGSVFTGPRWLEIAVRPGSDSGDYTPLAPRQPLLPAPYALNSASTSSLQGYALSESAPAPGQVLKWDGSQWTPGSDNSGGDGGPVSWNDLTNVPADLADGDDNTTYSAGTGLNLNGSKTFSLKSSYRLPQNCSTNQIIKFDGSSWVCAADPTADLAARVAALETLLFHVSRNGNDLTISGANLHVVNGSDSTDGDPNSLGNVIIGYNEERLSDDNDRSGSHMLVVGKEHNYSSFGGMVVGLRNETTGSFTSVSGGVGNTASGDYASVSGGAVNTASGEFASVSGGRDNTASGYAASVSGGDNNTAGFGTITSVSGGSYNTASGHWASVSGGERNTASGQYTAVNGGTYNTASGSYSAISGGANNTAGGSRASVSGGASNVANGRWSSVSGGLNRSVSGDTDWRAGGYFSDQ